MISLPIEQCLIKCYRCKDGEVQEERKEYESFKRKLQQQLTHLEEETDAQKREITAGKGENFLVLVYNMICLCIVSLKPAKYSLNLLFN